MQYPDRTVKRAEMALRCSPVQLPLLAAMREQSVPLKAIALQSGVENGYTEYPFSELAIENALGWLIDVGILRREVDGQGITDSFRLTPLGRHLVEKWENQGGKLPAPSLGDRFQNTLTRWFKL